MIDFGLLQWAFFWAIISRVYRHWKKSRTEEHIEVNLPEGVKFLITIAWIYSVAFFIIKTLDVTSILIQKIFG